MAFEEKTAEINKTFKCTGCSAPLAYKPGTDYLLCPYCGTRNTIAQNLENAPPLTFPIDYEHYIASIKDVNDNRYEELQEIAKCTNCGASTTLPSHVVAAKCAFCSSPLVIDHHTEHIVRPQALVPFFIDNKLAYQQFKIWGGKRWFAPNDFKRIFDTYSLNALKGVYIPFWVFNANTVTDYTGERGDHYYVERTVRDKDGNTTTVQDQRTRWRYASGRVSVTFKDITICASQSLSQASSDKLGPWHLDRLVPFNEQYISGFSAQTYQLDPQAAMAEAKAVMQYQIRGYIKDDIGGDEQRIDSADTYFSKEGIRYVLLPVWLTSYKYNGKYYQIMINAFSGKVYGDRPYSTWKIVGAILLGIIILYIISLFLGAG
ncbi:hypothetical protein ACR78F_11520 [Sphingobacterium spiritivorum]|uniref:hypothetical protein n=1 Tax=Sphingobacterium spiritivorum TaxID=258 RepID=UPI003DA6B87F